MPTPPLNEYGEREIYNGDNVNRELVPRGSYIETCRVKTISISSNRHGALIDAVCIKRNGEKTSAAIYLRSEQWDRNLQNSDGKLIY